MTPEERARIEALADEWEQQGREAEVYINKAHHTEIHEVMAEARWFPERAAELRALLSTSSVREERDGDTTD